MIFNRIRCFVVSTAIAAPLAFGGAQAANVSQVTTVAGSGAAGIADGPAAKASMIQPYGIAIAKGGTIIFSDRYAQRIRELTSAGQVRTLAGSGAVQRPVPFVVGGYRDGPALKAQFNEPTGIAIGKDGAIYIADNGNACVRKLQNGIVTTVVGSPTRRGVIDGPASSAGLVHPNALAFDEDGTLYIADEGGGLRVLDTRGNLTTFVFPKDYAQHAQFSIGITFAYKPEKTLLLSTRNMMLSYDFSSGKTDGIGQLYTEEGDPFGIANQVATLGPREYLFSDVQHSQIRYYRAPAPPFNGQYFAHAIAGGEGERYEDNAGFRDGSRADARFWGPMGIAVAGNAVYVADAGNRRIRRVSLPNHRISETGFATGLRDDSHYEVALVGASWTFWSSLGDDSICAAIERTLDASHRFSKPVRCHTVQINGTRINAIENYVQNVFTVEHMDLVIMDAASQVDSPETFRNDMVSMLGIFTPLKTRLALVWVYNVQNTSTAEWLVQSGPYYREPPSDYVHLSQIHIQKLLQGLPILQYDLYDDVVKYESSNGASPLYHPLDQHPNPRGNDFLGTHFALGLLRAGLTEKWPK